jgi:hypothetical protein
MMNNMVLEVEGKECPLDAGGFDTVFQRPLIGVTFVERSNR